MKKHVLDPQAATALVRNGAVVAVAGFGEAGSPDALLDALLQHKPQNLTIVANNAGYGTEGLAGLVLSGIVSRLVCSYPTAPGAGAVLEQLAQGDIELEIVPQGTLVERLRAAGAGLGGILTPTGVGTLFADNKMAVKVDGRDYIVEPALHVDVALVHAAYADPWGNLHYRQAAHNFNHAMATAAAITIAEIETLETHGLDPETVHTPGVFVDKLVPIGAGQ